MTQIDDLKGMTVAAVYVELERAVSDIKALRARQAELRRVAAKLNSLGVPADSPLTVADAVLEGTFTDRPRKRRAKAKPEAAEIEDEKAA
jgi:hypothetical protein